MSSDYLLGDCHTHLDKYPAAEMPGILDRAREAAVAFAVCALKPVTPSSASRGCETFVQQWRRQPPPGGLAVSSARPISSFLAS